MESHKQSVSQWRVFNWMSVGGILLLLLAATAEAWDWRFGAAGTLIFFSAIAVVSLYWLWERASILGFFLVLASVLNAWGWVWGWYHAIGWYDELAHLLTPVAVTPVAAWFLMEEWIDSTDLQQNKFRISLVVIAVGSTLGAWWEIGEWIAYLSTSDPQIIKSLQDTITDMILDTIGAIISLPIFYSIKRIKPRRSTGFMTAS